MRRRIGVFLSQMEEKTQKSILEAFTKEAYAHDYDLVVFSTHQKYQNTELRNIGDFNIFSLAQFDKFDGILILLDTILAPGVAQDLLEKIHNQFDGPVIVVDKENPYFESVMMNHYTPIVKLVDHLIEVHNYTDIAFLGGKKDHPHSIQRLNGYLDSMKAHGLTVAPDRVFHGDYWFTGGYKFADYLNEHRDNLPQAVACANDYMAIGLAARLSDYGFKIPEDLAISGYDSVDEGKLAPAPLTSAEIPAAQCGKICFYKLHSAITSTQMPTLSLDTELFIGGSCGCKDYNLTYLLKNRKEWKSDYSVSSFFSDLNHITEDMICQTDFDKFFAMLVRYSYQVRPFHRLWFCLNEGYDDPKSFISDNAITNGYAQKMRMVIKCGEDIGEQDAVDPSRVFDTTLMLPELYEEREYPTTFVFTPMFFEDRCFGYAVLNKGPESCIYEKTFRVWMRNTNQAMESFYRQRALRQLISDIKADQIRDAQTGLYNYKGFQNKISEMTQECINTGKSLAIIAIDLENMKGINSTYGRKVGDDVLIALSKLIINVTTSDEVCGRLCNDEFLIGFVSYNCQCRFAQIEKQFEEQCLVHTTYSGEEIYAVLLYAMKEALIDKLLDVDYLINQTVNAKNYKKKLRRQKAMAYDEMTAEETDICDNAERIINSRSLTFHFQPIVRAKDGSIFGYEALMRDESESKLSPRDILEAANRLKRLYDIEEQTFNGVLDRIESTPKDFSGKKVFINSLPAHQLTGEEEASVLGRFNLHRGEFVIEYTEDSQVSGAVYDRHREEYDTLDFGVALDDYGSGYSNTNNLLRYAPDYVKLDRELVTDIDKNPQKRFFVKSIIDYSKNNDIAVIAEGVETEDELRAVISLGVELIQGYYTARPQKQPLKAIDNEIVSQIIRINGQLDKMDVLRSAEA